MSVGRLVAFKGFADLIDACAELARRRIDFVCDIIGDGPLRETLQAKIEQLDLSSRVNLLGSLSQGAVLEKLQAADIFALASTTDAQGATDVFPTVILEAMASARPVVSTRLAGIPELVVDGQTGMLAPPGDSTALAQALEQLLRDPELRLRFGHAGRARIEQHFRIEQTVAPLVQLLERSCSRRPAGDVSVSRSAAESSRRASHPPSRSFGVASSEAATAIAYLIDRWPDRELPLLEREVEEMKRRNVPILPFVCELNSSARLNGAVERVALVTRISARCDGIGSRMADKPGFGATVGGRPRTAKQPRPRRNFPPSGSVCARAAKINSRKKRITHSRYEFSCAGLRDDVKEAPRCDSKRHD